MNIQRSLGSIASHSSGASPIAYPPDQATPVPAVIEALREISELDGLIDEEYTWIASHCTERVGPDRSIVFSEHEPAYHLHIILRGEVHVHRRNSGPVALFIGRTGRITGKLPYSRMKTWRGDGWSSGSLWVLDIHETHFPAMLQAIPSMTQRCVSILLDRVRDFTRADEQTAKLAALGKLAANLAHELNNPASAAQRAAADLRSSLFEQDQEKYCFGKLAESDARLALYAEWARRARRHLGTESKIPANDNSMLASSDREEQFSNWLESRGVTNAWMVAPTLAETALPLELLDQLALIVPPRALPTAISIFAGTVRAERTTAAITDSTTRIFEIIAAIKDYSYMDQDPIQDVNLAQSLENTLAMMSSRMEHVAIERDYGNVPPFRAFGSELNQVWTALIENSLDAMQDRGSLRLTTRWQGDLALVEVWDDGPGIDPALRSRIFEPFFTTKPIGRGLGLGLDTVQRVVNKHYGSVDVESRPGATCFQVRLPLDRVHVY